ncbi:molybdopterin/thiamine biosynthesis adenylyltransferase [Desulfobaculum xiamenense]|uniref:Molybdopterin/thiamine biosynthesis adenylyltransferase n=1 Tax=Desulfobaculum xiamenense TaxID=995050 RepID=A0A846QNU0_9BACT|nr:ThiF family adenylyltransferase [Desulfobaculum xiamenense]NJB68132.1 molybdopterin/thiamine biosynthesis adenylyltransferase [Desulfobaculum xiamenense]
MGNADPLGLRIRECARPKSMPDDTPYLSIGLDATAQLAAEFRVPLREVEIAALGAGVVPEHYVRNFHTVDMTGQARLLSSRAALVGLGGLGGLLIEAMARMGVGRIVAADGDRFEESNLNRQLTSSSTLVGLSKARIAAMRVADVNPAVECVAHESFADEADMASMCASADVAVDALGGLDNRPALQRAATSAGIPLVTAGIAGLSGYVATVLPGQPGPSDFLGTGHAAEDSQGSPAPGVYAAASLQSAEIMRILSGQPPALAGRMLVFDLRDASFETVTIVE